MQHYLDVRNMREVAREFRVSRTTVAKLLAERGIDTSRKMGPADIATAVELYAAGESSIRIGKQLGFDNHTVLKVLRSLGIIVRPPAATRVDSDVDVDRLDYLQRDALRAGTEFGSIDRQRLIDSIELHRVSGKAHVCSWKLGYGYRARTAIETLLTNRLRYYQWVLFHPHVAAANKFLDLALQELIDLSKLAVTTGTSEPDLQVARAIDEARPDLNFFTPREQPGRRQLALGPHAAKRPTSDPDRLMLQASVDDSTITEWMKTAASLARASMTSPDISSGLRARLARYTALHDACLFRVPNWAPVWKTEDQFAEFASEIAEPLIEVLASLAEDTGESGKKHLSDMSDELLGDQTAAGGASVGSPQALRDRITSRTLASLVDRLKADPSDGLNGVADLVLRSSQPHRRLEEERMVASMLDSAASQVAGLRDGLWVLAFDRVSALRDGDSGVVVWRSDQPLPLKSISSMVSILPEIAKTYPQMFAYFVVPGQDAMREGRESTHGAEIRRAFLKHFPGVVDRVLRSRTI